MSVLVAGSLSVGALTAEADASGGGGQPTTLAAPMPIGTDIAPPEQDQIRIEHTVIIRVPRAPANPRKGSLKPDRTNWAEEKMGNCLMIKKIAGVRVSTASTLELLTVDGHQVRAYLNKDCEAREFYSGFYIEKPKDGNFCKGREVLHARSGAECRVTKFRLLKPR